MSVGMILLSSGWKAETVSVISRILIKQPPDYAYYLCMAIYFPIASIFSVNIGDISTDAQWFIGNVGQYGYYRVNYDIENWEALLQQLSSDHQVGCLFLTPALK